MGSGADLTSAISEDTPSKQPAVDIPGMVNNGTSSPAEGSNRGLCDEVHALVPDRFIQVHPLSVPDKCLDDTRGGKWAGTEPEASAILLATDTTDGGMVALQLLHTASEHARVRECQQKCCLRPNDAPRSPTSSLTSPMSSPRGEPMIVDILEIHGDAKYGGWLAVLEEVDGSLEDIGEKTPLSVQQKRSMFLRVTRAVQVLHSAGLVHNGISPQSIVHCATGYKLGDYRALQRHGEMARERRSKGAWVAPELRPSVLDMDAMPIKCDFATDVWCLGALLCQLVLGGIPEGDLSDISTFEAAGEEVASLLHRMMSEDAGARPVIDVVLQDAIRCLYLPTDGSMPHDSLEFDSPLKTCRPVVGNTTLKSDDFGASALDSSKARPLGFSLPAPARRCDDMRDEAVPSTGEAVKEEAAKHRSDATGGDSEGAAHSSCECKCVVQ